ncbi:hypothetical protein ACSU1N_04980 [Thermogladius sp. 4427co]|uniref:hypothetical protein n=1 Tax=Thermogladius sp. 4427co TaxID=3450718 RepID=UPI003F795CE3
MIERKLSEKSLVSLFILGLLVLIALIGAAEKNPPGLGVYVGASPLNNGYIGTSSLVTMLEGFGKVYVVTDLNSLNNIPGQEYCLFIDISPEQPYSVSDARLVAQFLARCSHPYIIIADENSTSNYILGSLGIDARIMETTVFNITVQPGLGEEVVYIPATKEFIPPHPVASITIGNKTFALTLDIASYITAGRGVQILGNYSVGNRTYIAAVRSEGRVSYDNVSKTVIAYIFSDGSIFLNQVIEYNASYREFATTLLRQVCQQNCMIVVDNSRYRLISLSSIRNPLILIPTYLSVSELLGLMIANIIHPSTWLPVVVKYTNDLLSEVVSSKYLGSLVASIIALIALLALARTERPVRDKPLQEVVTAEVGYARDIRDAILSGRLKLSSEDFKKLYEIVDNIMLSTYGRSLRDPTLERILSAVVESRRARKYLNSMNRLYSRSTGASMWPIVLSWNRTTRKYLRETEEILSRIGYSLLKMEVLTKITRG